MFTVHCQEEDSDMVRIIYISILICNLINFDAASNSSTAYHVAVNDHEQNSQLSVSTSKEMLFRKSNATAEIAKRSINLMALGR